MQDKIDWIFEQHRKTNHLYDGMPYEFHLKATYNVGQRFLEKIGVIDNEVLDLSLYGHDLIEDTRNTYNDVAKVLGDRVANIIYLVTNEKGKNRKERANDKYYAGIRGSLEAIYVKICDRIANIEYAKISNNKNIISMYKKEHHSFCDNVQIFHEWHPFDAMADHMQYLLNSY